MTGSSSVLLAHSYFLAYDPKQVRKMKPYPPLATLLAAAVLKRLGAEVSLFDAMLEPDEGGFLSALSRERPAVVALLEDNFNFLTKMCTTRMREAALRMIAAAREAGCLVLVNGSDASDHADLYLGAGADAVILGETEVTLPDLLEAWKQGRDLASVAGLALPAPTRGGAPIVRKTPPRPFVEELDALPFPAWELVDVARYREAWTAAHGRLSWNAVTTRGCPFHCNWCAKPLYGTRYAQRSPGDVAEELKELAARVSPDHVWFADDIFGLTKRWIETFADEVERRGVKIPFTMQSRVDLMTPSAARARARAGGAGGGSN
jgi:anaerobic magnesium-protoporphyrin IX monomethyl ester cyclase